MESSCRAEMKKDTGVLVLVTCVNVNALFLQAIKWQMPRKLDEYIFLSLIWQSDYFPESLVMLLDEEVPGSFFSLHRVEKKHLPQ